MKRLLTLTAVVVLSAVMWGCSGSSSFQMSENGFYGNTQRGMSTAPDGDRYIVVLKDVVADVPSAARGIAGPFGVNVDRTYSHALKGFAAKLPPQALAGVRNHPLVDYVEPDIVLDACGKPLKPPADGELQWGVDRIDADKNTGAKGSGVTVVVLDTGIDTDHPELVANYKGGYDFVNNDASPEDDAGHGTHVSGIIAADNNGTGVIGVAPDAGLVAVKVLDSAGSGAISWIIAGIDWVIANKDGYGGIKVANMSFGGYGTSDALHAAIQNLEGAGVTITAAASCDRVHRRVFAFDGFDFENFGERLGELRELEDLGEQREGKRVEFHPGLLFRSPLRFRSRSRRQVRQLQQLRQRRRPDCAGQRREIHVPRRRVRHHVWHFDGGAARGRLGGALPG